MADEFYGLNLFGEKVDVGLVEPEEEKPAPFIQGQGFNIFALTDAVGARNKRNAWMIYEQALASGLSADEIFYRVMWIVKSMIIATKTKDYTETDMKEFPYGKAREFARNFSPLELEELNESLVVGYHQARRGIGEIETLIEKMLLSL